MENITKLIREYVIEKSDLYNKKNNYDFWNEHIKFVVKSAIDLAKKYNADAEIVEIAALLHDISLICDEGPREEHHIYSTNIAERLLTEYGYPQDKIELIKKCIFNHRDKNKYPRNTIEEDCVGDADIISHFYNIPMSFSKAYLILKLSHADGVKYLIEKFEEDYEGLSENTQKEFKARYEEIMRVVFGK